MSISEACQRKVPYWYCLGCCLSLDFKASIALVMTAGMRRQGVGKRKSCLWQMCLNQQAMAQMTFHCHSSDPVNFCLEIRVSLGSKEALALWFLSLHSGLCPHRFNARFQWLGPQCSLHGIERNPGGRSRAEFWRQTEHGGTGKALRMRKVERGKQERAGKPGLWTWGKSAINRNTHKKGSRQSHQRDTSQGQKQNKRLNGWNKLSREEFRTEAGEEKGENDVVLCCDRSVRSWVEDGQGREEKICWAHCCHTSCLVDSTYKEAS